MVLADAELDAEERAEEEANSIYILDAALYAEEWSFEAVESAQSGNGLFLLSRDLILFAGAFMFRFANSFSRALASGYFLGAVESEGDAEAIFESSREDGPEYETATRAVVRTTLARLGKAAKDGADEASPVENMDAGEATALDNRLPAERDSGGGEAYTEREELASDLSFETMEEPTGMFCLLELVWSWAHLCSAVLTFLLFSFSSVYFVPS